MKNAALLVPAFLAAVFWGCGTDGGSGSSPGKGAAKEGKAMELRISSTAFQHMGSIPSKYTADGENISPPLAWSGVPEGTKSLALIVDDPDAPGNVWVHWVLYDIPPGAGGLKEGVSSSELPPGTREGLNDWGKKGYGGPSPPSGTHRYFFKLYALDTVLPELGRPTKAALEAAMEGHVLAKAELVGTYKRKGR